MQTTANHIKKFGLGLIAGAAVTALTALLLSLLMTASPIPDALTGACGYIAAAAGAFGAGLCAVLLIRSKGLLNGAIAGAAFVALHLIVSLAAGSGGGVFSLKMLLFAVIELAAAALGGVVGVNIRK